MYEIKKELKDQIQKCVLDAYHYGTKDYRNTIRFENGVDDYYNVIIEFANHEIEIFVFANEICEMITLPYGKQGWTALIEMINASIGVLVFKMTGNY